MNTSIDRISPLRDFVIEMTRLVEKTNDEPILLEEGKNLLAPLIADDSWLPDEFAQPHPEYYQQYLLHCDPLERFSVVSFVWGPGQITPIHDHTVWGLIGMLRGAELSKKYTLDAAIKIVAIEEVRLERQAIAAVSPTIGDVHLVANALSDQSSISIHVYGGNIGAVRRHVFDMEKGISKDFISGYSSMQLPNLWDRSAQIREKDAK